MTLTMREAHRHADRILELVRKGAGEQLSDPVAQSWSRCINEYQMHPARPLEPVFISRNELEDRRARRADVIACARYEMTTLYQQLGDAEAAVVLTDTDGVIVHMVTSPEFAAEVGPLGLRVGGQWSEASAGTNGMGTCLAAGSPVSVRREDHFFTQFSQLTCSAVPVVDPSGEIAAVLDVSSRSSLMQQHLLVLLGMTVRMIENRLIDARFRNAHPLHFHSRPEFVYTLHEGKLAVGDDGRILAANRSALFQLGLPSMDDIRSRNIEDLFQTSLEDMLQRSTSSSFHPVVTYRTNAALRFFAVARRPASDAESPAALSGRAVTVTPLSGAPLRTPAARVVQSPAQPASTFKDPRLVAHLDTARRVIANQTPVLLCGETGSGKEVFARAVHDASPHASGAFVAVTCASLPETLIEAVRSRARSAPAGAARFCRPTAARCSSTRLPTCRWSCRRACCACSTSATSPRWAPKKPMRWTSSSSVPAINICRPACAKGASAKTCSIALPASSCSCRRCASAATSAS
jgi:transcriptional regulator of acetoin/glycerol metabolism